MGQATSNPGIHPARAAVAARERPSRSEAARRRLQGRALTLARTAWLTLAAVTVAVYAVGVWVRVGQLQVPCAINQLSQGNVAASALCRNGRLPDDVQRAFAVLHLSVGFYGWYELGLDLLFAVCFAAVAALLFWRHSRDPLALFVSLALLVFGLGTFESGVLAGGLPTINAGWRLPVALLGYLGVVAFGTFLSVFPDGRFVPRWTALAVVAIALWFLPYYLFPGSPLDFTTWPALAFFGVAAALFAAMGAAQIHRYRRVSTPAQRLQTKWVVYGLVAAAGGYFGGTLLGFLFAPALTSPAAVLADLAGGTLKYISFLLIPICIAVAILRHRLFDIDLIINQTLVYGVLVAILLVLYETLATVFEHALVALTGQSSLAVDVSASFFVGTLAEPLRKRVQKLIDRLVYPRKYEAERRIEAFSRQLRRDLDAETMSERAEGEIEERAARAWAALRPGSSRRREYVQERLFP